MPRLSLYRPNKGNDYRFIDKTVWEMFQVGGTDIFVHAYIGPSITPAWSSTTAYKIDTVVSYNNVVYKSIRAGTNQKPPNATYWQFIREGTPSSPIYTTSSTSNIQDLLLLENRDRKYADDIFMLRGVYNVQDIDFNLSQFGLFLQNDTIMITFHINDTVERLGRKLMSGDVVELPHLKDDYALNDIAYALKRFYVIEDVNRPSEGFSATWYPHLYRAKCKPMVDSQEFSDILNTVADTNDETNRGEWKPGITYFPNDRITGPDGLEYVCIDPINNQWAAGKLYYPGDVVTAPNGNKYVVIDSAVPKFNGGTIYQPNDILTGPDGKIYSVKNTILTRDGISGVIPPDTAVYTPIKGRSIIGENPMNSSRYQSIDIVNNGITDVFPPNATYWTILETLKDINSTYETDMSIMTAILDQAESDSMLSGPDTTYLYSLQTGDDGLPVLVTVDTTNLDASIQTQATDYDGNLLVDSQGNPLYLGPTTATIMQTASSHGYHGIIYDGDGIPPNGALFTAGISFPMNPAEGQFCLRKDFFPYRLFRFTGFRWAIIEQRVRMTMSNLSENDTKEGARFEGRDARKTLLSSFINNTNEATINGRNVVEKQSLSKALLPKADE